MEYLELVRKLDSMTGDLLDLEPDQLRQAVPNAKEVALALICAEESAKHLRKALGYETFQVAVRVEVRPGPEPPDQSA
ncbi:MAG: hypothetical protein ACRDHE_09450 [Ktedonobacterales bacterium]